MAKKQSSRSRDARQKAEKELMFDTNKAELDGKTRVQDKIAELSVRGVIGENDDIEGDKKEKKKALKVPGLGASNSGGISKKKKLSHKQKKRQGKAIERAEQIQEQRDKKVKDSVEQLNKLKERRTPWEKYNELVAKNTSDEVKNLKS